MTEQQLTARIKRWREKAAEVDTFHATMAVGWKTCADELEADLRAERLNVFEQFAETARYPNWNDMDTLSVNDPIIYAAVTRVRSGDWTREQALVWIVVKLREQTQVLDNIRVDAVMIGYGFLGCGHQAGEFKYQRLDPKTVVRRLR